MRKAAFLGRLLLLDGILLRRGQFWFLHLALLLDTITGFYACLGLHGFLLSQSLRLVACFPCMFDGGCYATRMPAFTLVLAFMAAPFAFISLAVV